ncbi:nucleotidyltransferase family protein [Rhodopila sp.]|uniref:nucleotidyltransferase family protein n=1 Tax=Rhodopila sp. TaxID=2480087 RepID=UPI003D11599B
MVIRPTKMSAVDHTSTLQAILSSDQPRQHIFGLVQALALPDCWIGAGFIRNAVWNHLHGSLAPHYTGDVDVLWFDPERTDPSEDRRLEAALRTQAPPIGWSVKNQARMHTRNNDPPYASTVDAMLGWPETATAVAARRTRQAAWEIAAPFGLEDLFALVLRPTPRFAGEKRTVFLDRIQSKRWLETWPLLRLEDACIERGRRLSAPT